MQSIEQLFKRDSQRARADGIERVNDELIFTARRINRKLSPRAYVQTVRRTKTDPRVGRAKTFRAQLRVLILQREIPVPRRVVFEIRDFTLKKNGGEARLERDANGVRELGDC